MIPKIIAKGKSFKGAALYLLHDKDRAVTSERIAWTQTHNLAVDDPHLGWKIMAATAMDQERLKATAGIKVSGRRSENAVLHMTLAWHPEEKDRLTREEMQAAALQALEAIGASDRQAIIIAHNDEAHPHLHILCNRVSPEDGRMLASSNDRLKLSEWAEAYETERGRVFCETRVVNNDRRRSGEYVRGPQHVSRHLLEFANDNSPGGAALQSAQRQADRALKDRTRDTLSRHRQEWRNMELALKRLQADARATLKHRLETQRRTIQAEFAPRHAALARRHRQERETLARKENAPLGGLRNAFGLIRPPPPLPGEQPRATLAHMFSLLGSARARQAVLEKRQAGEAAKLRAAERREIKERLKLYRQDGKMALAALGAAYLRRRERLIERHEADKAQLKAQWKQRRGERRRAYELGRAALERGGNVQDAFAAVSAPPPAAPPEKQSQRLRAKDDPQRLTRAERREQKLEQLKSRFKKRDGREREP